MTKKNYILIADTLKECGLSYKVLAKVGSVFASKLKAENPTFNENRFMDYLLEEAYSRWIIKKN